MGRRLDSEPPFALEFWCRVYLTKGRSRLSYVISLDSGRRTCYTGGPRTTVVIVVLRSFSRSKRKNKLKYNKEYTFTIESCRPMNGSLYTHIAGINGLGLPLYNEDVYQTVLVPEHFGLNRRC